MRRSAWRRPGVAWAAVCLALGVGSLAVWVSDAPMWEWQRERAVREPWRWWSAAFVHYSQMHLGGNLAGLGLTAAFGWVAQAPLRATVAWWGAWPLTHLGLWLLPGLKHYGGLSGVVHAGVAIVIAHLLATGTRGQRVVAGAVLAGLLAKIATETPWGAPVQYPAGWDIGIAPMAHVTGVVAGALCYLLACSLRQRCGRLRRESA